MADRMSVGVDVIPELSIDVGELTRVAGELRAKARDLPAAAAAVVQSWDGLGAVYEAPETAELNAKMMPLAPVGIDVCQALARAADIVDQLADDLMWLAMRRRGLVEDVEDLSRTPEDADSGELTADLKARIDHFGAALEERLDRARADVAAIAPPAACIGEIPDAVAPPRGPGMTWAAHSETTATDLVLAPLLALARSGTSRIARLLAAHPEWAELLRQRPPSPTVVRAWWQTLPPATVAALIDGAPALIGALGGVPPLDRVAANRVSARVRLREVEAEIPEWELVSTEGASADLQAQRRAALAALRAEGDYLRRVVAGDVTLVLYQPDDNRIVEMIGTPGSGTRRVLTYVPGTFTTVGSFYDRSAQAMPAWLAEQDDGMVAFVWKGSQFPGDDEGSGATDQLRGILEANEQSRGVPAGEALARFVGEMRSDPAISDARQIGAGYSWGLVPLTSSEMAGTHYDAVHSFAGAWVPEGWGADPTTTYFHWSYTDFLSMAQDVGLVGEARNPDTTPGFQSRIYDRPGDYDVPLGGELAPFLDPDGPSIRISLDPFANHQLISSAQPENYQTAAAISEAMMEGQR